MSDINILSIETKTSLWRCQPLINVSFEINVLIIIA